MSQTQRLPMTEITNVIDKENAFSAPVGKTGLAPLNNNVNQPLKKKNNNANNKDPLKPSQQNTGLTDKKRKLNESNKPSMYNNNKTSSPTKKQLKFTIFEDAKQTKLINNEININVKLKEPIKIEAAPIQNNNELVILQQENTRLKEIILEKDAFAESLHSKIKELEEQIHCKENDLNYYQTLYLTLSAEAKESGERHKTEIESKETTKEVLRKKIQVLAKEKAAMKQEYENKLKELTETEALLRETNSQIANQKIAELQFNMEIIIQEKDQLKRQVEELLQKLQDKQ
ncbi:hypothetical protein ABK040_007799 [Willaertia magna]